MTQQEFIKGICDECGIKYYPHILGTTEDIGCICVQGTDIQGKTKLKEWFKKHHWVFIENNDRIAKMPFGDVHLQEVKYQHNNHKIIISVEWD